MIEVSDIPEFDLVVSVMESLSKQKEVLEKGEITRP